MGVSLSLSRSLPAGACLPRPGFRADCPGLTTRSLKFRRKSRCFEPKRACERYGREMSERLALNSVEVCPSGLPGSGEGTSVPNRHPRGDIVRLALTQPKFARRRLPTSGEGTSVPNRHPRGDIVRLALNSVDICPSGLADLRPALQSRRCTRRGGRIPWSSGVPDPHTPDRVPHTPSRGRSPGSSPQGNGCRTSRCIC